MSGGLATLRGLGVLLALVLCSALLASVLAPWVHAGLRALGVEDARFAEVVFRLWQASAMLLTALALAALGAPGRSSWGLALAPHPALRALRAFALGTAALGLVVVILYVLEVRTPRPETDGALAGWLDVLARALIGAAVIAVLEELWFRGGLYTLLRRYGGTAVAVWLGSAGYALSHFLDRDVPVAAGAQDWHAAVQLLAASGQGLLRLENLDSLLALLAAGLWLSALRRRDSDIVAAVALHMSFVVVIKVFKKLTYIDPDAPQRWIAGRYDDLIGWLAFLVLLAFAVPALRRAGPATGAAS